MISRRAVLRSIPIALGIPTRPRAAHAQEPGRTYRFGALFNSPRDAPQNVAFFDELRRAGFVGVRVDGFGLRTERFADFAREFVQAKVDIIMCGGDPAIRAAQQATATIPILAVTDDMAGSGLIRSLSKPGGNTTGVSILANQLDGKRQEILIDMLPRVRRMAALVDPATTAPRQFQALQDSARARGVKLSIHRIATPEGIVPAIEAAKKEGAAALNVLATPLFFNSRRLIFARATALRLQGMYQWPEMAEEGGLAAYGPRIVQIFRELMTQQAVKLLRGAKPSDLPVEQPTRFELVINVKTAKALGVAIPPSVLHRADHLIE